MSNIKINYLGYKTILSLKNSNTTLGNSSYKVEAISAPSTNVGYNSNRPKNDVYHSNINNKTSSSFEDILKEEMSKQKKLSSKNK